MLILHGSVLSELGKGGRYTLQEWIKELSESEPTMRCRENELGTENLVYVIEQEKRAEVTSLLTASVPVI